MTFEWAESVGTNIQVAREKNALSRRALAEIIGVMPNTIWRWESGERQPDIGNLYKLAYALKTSVAFFTGEVCDPNLLSNDINKMLGTDIHQPCENEPEHPKPAEPTTFTNFIPAQSAGSTLLVSTATVRLPAKIIESIAALNGALTEAAGLFTDDEARAAESLLHLCLKNFEAEPEATQKQETAS